MGVRKIAQIGNPALRVVAREVPREELLTSGFQSLIDDLIETMRHANGAGLAATQICEPVRVCTLEVADNPRYPYKPKIPLEVLINPKLEFLSDETFDNYEGCLSVPNLRGIVPRYLRARVTAWDRQGNAIDKTVSGISAGTYQHEIDHLDGLLFVDRVLDTKTLCTWDEFDAHHKEAFIESVHKIEADK